MYPGNTGGLVVGGFNPDTICWDGSAGQSSLAILLEKLKYNNVIYFRCLDAHTSNHTALLARCHNINPYVKCQ